MTVYEDAVKLESENERKIIGWFRDEVSALSAGAEWTLMRSAILAELRKLPEMVVCSRYILKPSGKKPRKYTRATRTRIGRLGRKVVRLPNSADKVWLR